MPNIHPVLTHFPIVLLTLSLLFDGLGALLRRADLERIGSWAQLLGIAALAVTIGTGLAARNGQTIGAEAVDVIQMHQEIAFAVVAIASLLLLWRIAGRLRLPDKHRSIYLLLSLAMVTLLWVGAWYGGKLVYEFGIGVQHIVR